MFQSSKHSPGKVKTIITSGVNQYTSKRNKHRNTKILQKLLDAEKNLSFVTKNYTALQVRIKTITELSGFKQVLSEPLVTDNIEVEPQKDDAYEKHVRDEVIKSLTPQEIVLASRIKAKEEFEARKFEFENIEHLCTFPHLLISNSGYLSTEYNGDNESNVRLKTRPYFEYYNLLLKEVAKLDRLNQRKTEESQSIGVKNVRAITVVEPNYWFRDFLYVFNHAQEINSNKYPAYQSMNNIYYEEKTVREIINGKQSQMFKIHLYSLDIPYHLVRFGSLYSTIYFQPIATESLTMQSTCYTDMEILIHFSVCMTDKINYRDFLQHPGRYLDGSKRQLLVDAVQNASEIIRLSYTKPKLFFFYTKTTEFNIGLFQYNEEGRKKSAVVPSNIMSVMRLFILDNLQVYKQRMLSEQYAGCTNFNDGFMIQKHSPIGKLLNFDKRGAFEFEKLSKRLCKSDPSSVNLQIASHVSELSCVIAIYALLVSASGAIYAVTKNEQGQVFPDEVISRTMIKMPNTDDGVMYAGTLETFPGLLMYTMLGTLNDNHKLTESYKECVGGVELPGMTKPAYFSERKERVAFFDSFSSYSYSIPKLNELKQKGVHSEIRWVSMEQLQQVRVSAKQNIQIAKASYIDILLTLTVQHSDQFYDNNTLNYFRTPLAKFEPTELKVNINLTDNFVLFMLPLLFTVSSRIVTIEKPFKQPHMSYAMSFFQLENDIQDREREKDMNETYVASQREDDTY